MEGRKVYRQLLKEKLRREHLVSLASTGLYLGTTDVDKLEPGI